MALRMLSYANRLLIIMHTLYFKMRSRHELFKFAGSLLPFRQSPTKIQYDLFKNLSDKMITG